jgi:hypothetical protein
MAKAADRRIKASGQPDIDAGVQKHGVLSLEKFF